MDGHDPEYVAARKVLLDVLDALAEHRDALVVVGAQAVYLRTEPLEGYQPFTTDADLGVDPSLLASRPGLEHALRRAGFTLKNEDTGHPEPGVWEARVRMDDRLDDLVIAVDLIVPEGVAPSGGRRGARLGGEHGKRAARRATGLEGALVDHSQMVIGALKDSDPRQTDVNVAGVAALLVSKVHKIDDRSGRPDRLTDKDGGDVLRLFLSSTPAEMVERFVVLLGDTRSAETTRLAIDRLGALFWTPRGVGTEMAVHALSGVMEAATVTQICTTFTTEMLDRLRSGGVM
jgi:hypothetical protein